MAMDLAEKEFYLIREISRNPVRTQRELSTEVGLSLGMTNLLIRRLALKGYVKTTQLTWNKVQYILTPKGMLEKARKSFNYSAWALRHLKSVVNRIRGILLAEHRAGRREFHIVAADEGGELVQMALDGLDLRGARVHRHSSPADVPRHADAAFLATSRFPSTGRGTRAGTRPGATAPGAERPDRPQEGRWRSGTRWVPLLDGEDPAP